MRDVLETVSYSGKSQPTISLGNVFSMTNKFDINDSLTSPLAAAPVYDTLPEPVYVLSASGTIIYCNSRVETCFGKTPQELVGRRITQCISPENAQQLLKTVATVITSREKQTIIHKYLLHGGEHFFQIAIAPLSLSTTAERTVICIATNISSIEISAKQQHVLEQKAQEARIAKQQFMANMNHEIRTPLNGIIGIMELLTETPLNNEQRNYVSIVQASSNTLLSLANTILDFSKIEANSLQLTIEPFSPRRLFEELIRKMATAAELKKLELGLQFHSAAPHTCKGDATRIWQVCLSILNNAIKFTEQGSVSVDVQFSEEHVPATTLHVTVTDTGIGIPAEQQAVLYSQFSQADSSNIRKYGGIGLGFAIAQRLVHLMQGTITVESHLRKGTTVAIAIPLITLSDTNRADDTHPNLPHQQCLVIGLREPTGSIVTSYCEELGFSVTSFPSCAAAVAAHERATSSDATPKPFSSLLFDHTITTTDVTTLLSRNLLVDSAEPHLICIGPLLDATQLKQSVITLDKPLIISELQACFQNRYLPTTPPPLPTTSPVKEHNNPVQTELPPDLHVLIADDNQSNSMVLGMTLQTLGITSDQVENGEEVLKACADKSYDCIFLDLQMPVMDGITTAELIRTGKRAVRHKDIYIIALTAYTSVAIRQHCIAVGINDFLSKPVVRTSILEALKRAVHTNLRATAARAGDEPFTDLRAITHDAAAFSAIMQRYSQEITEALTAMQKAAATGNRTALKQIVDVLDETARSANDHHLIAAIRLFFEALVADDTPLETILATFTRSAHRTIHSIKQILSAPSDDTRKTHAFTHR